MSSWQSAPRDRRPGNTGSGRPGFASGKTPKSRSTLVGRREELAVIAEMLEEVRTGVARTLLLAGEPGIGKTALTEVAQLMAEDFACLSCRGAEAESDLAYAGLVELLTPVRHLLDEVPEGQAGALAAVLGWRAASQPVDRFLVAAATLSLLAAAAGASPVLIVVDDLHWLDRESADAVTFAARRLSGDAVGFLFNARSNEVAPELVQGLSTLELVGLTEMDATELLPAELAPGVVGQLHAATYGNPLGLLETARKLAPEERTGAAPLPDPLPAGTRLDTVYDTTLATLSEPVRKALLLLALDPAAAADAELQVAFDEAVAMQALTAGQSGLQFRHPLLRSAVLRLSEPARKRAAHLQLAALLPPGSPGRVRHLAAAATGTDDALAAELARAADQDRARSGYARASAELERAAALTSDPQSAADRLSRAAQDAFLAGDLPRTRGLVQRVLGSMPTNETRGRALFTLGMLEQYAGSVVRAGDVLTQACSLLRGAELVDALNELSIVAFRLSDPASIAECAAGIQAEADREDPSQRLRADFTIGLARFVSGDYETAVALLGGLTDLALSEELRDDPRALLLMALAAGMSGTVDDALRRGASRVQDVRDRGAVGVLVQLLTLTAAAHAIVGNHPRAFADAGEAAELAECLGYVADAAVAVEQLAWQSAARGFHDDARASLNRARDLLERAGTTSAASHHALTAAFCASCRDGHDEVVRVLEERMRIDGGLGSMGEPLGVAPLLIEAYMSLGRTDEAAALTARLAKATPASSPPEMLVALLRSQGVTAADADEATDCFERALALLQERRDPYEEARTRLMYGSRLRRDGQRVRARDHLSAAKAAFESMELTRWAEVAAAELRATGANPRPRSAANEESLTSQETRVALLVAEGRSNKEVAAALFLSPKTIERHLGNVFRKKGFRSRAELIRAYSRESL